MKKVDAGVNDWAVLGAPWAPHHYQKKAVKFLLQHSCGALLLEPGLGKSAITLAAIKVLKEKGMISKVLIIAPLRVCYTVWPEEVQKWKDFSGLTIEVLHGKDKDEALRREADIYVINPEGLEWLMGAEKTRATGGKTKVTVNRNLWRYYGFDILVIDELSRMKNINTNRFKMLKQVIGTFSRRWGLTGSPAANGLMDLFGQFYIIDEGAALGRYITQYRMNYFDSDYNGYVWTLKDGAKEKIYERIKPLSLQMSCADYLDMPELINNTVVVELPKKVKDFYDELEDDLIAGIDNNIITAQSAAVASGKLRQIANGGIYLTPDMQFKKFRQEDIKKGWLNLHDEKTEALADLIDELQGAQVLVAYDFGHDLDRLRKAFPKAIFACDYNMKKFPALEKAWNNGEIPVLFGHAKAIAHGLNLQQCGNNVIFHSLTWSYEEYDQMIRRVYRQGNKEKSVFIHHIVAKGTIDEVIMKCLKSKKMTQQDLFEALKELKGRRIRNERKY